MLGVAVAGFLASLWVPPAPPAAPGLALHLNPLAEYRQLWRLARERRDVWLALLGVAWFWLLGAAYLTQLPNLVVAELGAGPAVLAALLVAATLGIGIGALACQRWAGGRIELGLVPLGALGVTAFGVHLASAVADGGGLPQGVLAFLADPRGRTVTFALFAIGFCGGLYVVPLNAAIQARTAPERRARVIAALNIASSLFMVAGSAAGAVLLGLFDLPLPAFFLGLALANGLVTLIIFFQLPEFAARLLIWLLVRALYRVRVVGLEHIPARGAALLVCNHVSYVDGLIVAGAIPRPVRFVMARSVWRHPLLHGLFRLAGAIPICPKGEDPSIYAAGMAAIRQALERGELVCVFPEGRLTPDGELGPFRPGILKMLSLVPVPVVPMALSGLWASLFSLGPWRLGRGPVVLSIGRPVPPEEVRLEALRATVEALRGERR
ncbi:MAG: hypothetical protein KatS3mg124_2253 [Porticoccaceae bacterium]|nr:MAG: hypothetical protein KatS3mg124_2253 [Porticoccaceae bacterium]